MKGIFLLESEQSFKVKKKERKEKNEKSQKKGSAVGKKVLLKKPSRAMISQIGNEIGHIKNDWSEGRQIVE